MIEIENFKVNSLEVRVGEALEFSFDIEAQDDEALMIDYVLYFQTKAGKFSPKVHKIKKLTMKKGKRICISKNHPFKANMTTRKLYAGEHRLVLQINGKMFEEVTFNLVL